MTSHGSIRSIFGRHSYLEYVVVLCGLLAVISGAILLMSSNRGRDGQTSLIEEDGQKIIGDAQVIICEVSGAVVHPGVIELPQGSRVGEALLRAGGLSSEVDIRQMTASLNLADQVQDGQKISVPSLGEAVPSGANANTISINTASLQELDSLSGVGKVTAEKIIENRPYATLESITEKKVITEKVFLTNREKLRL